MTVLRDVLHEHSVCPFQGRWVSFWQQRRKVQFVMFVL